MALLSFVARLSVASIVAGIAFLGSAQCWAISAGHVDNFNDGTTQSWRVGAPDFFPVNQADSGQNGVGDHSLFMATLGAGGSNPRLLVLNTSSNWTGNWTAAGITQLELDVFGPSSNSFPLQMRLGIAGPDGVAVGGGGDTYVTDAITVPSDNVWHHIRFDVLPADFNSTGGSDIDDALSLVTQFRILHNPEVDFKGADTSAGGGEFFLDNIRAIGAAARLPGDYNENNEVDSADYVLWRDTLNQTVTPGTGADGTGPSGTPDGVIDGLDYDFWRARFGNTPPGAGASLATVPEPATLTLFLAEMFAVAAAYRRIGRGKELAN